MDIKDIRYRNLLTLLDDISLDELAKRADTSTSYLCHLKRPDKAQRRAIGHAMARRLEKAARRTAGWMDTDHTASDTERQIYELAEKLKDLGPEHLDFLGGVFEKMKTESSQKLTAEFSDIPSKTNKANATKAAAIHISERGNAEYGKSKGRPVSSKRNTK